MKEIRVPFHAPIQVADTELQTKGCRHTNPDICAKHSLESVCAFVRKDQICVSPPASWKKQYANLSKDKGATE